MTPTPDVTTADSDRLDADTQQYGTEPPFFYWEDDHTALVHVLWDAEVRGLALRDFDDIASLIMRSRWRQATRADGAARELLHSAQAVIDEGGRRRAGSIADFLLARKDRLFRKERNR